MKKYITKILISLNNKGLLNWMPDIIFLKFMFRIRIGKKLNLINPQTYNEKLQWIKLYDRRDIYPILVDKYEAKKYVAQIIGKEYIIPTIGVWNKFEQIDFSILPKQFVIKCTHDSGGLVICKDKNTLKFDQVEKKINNCLKKNYYWHNREWPYKKVPPRIIIEKYMEDHLTKELRDYKIYCFNGQAKIFSIYSGRSKNSTKANFYDTNFNLLNISWGYPNIKENILRPKNMEKMIELAERLSVDIPEVRVDFYDVNGKIYFGELTLFDGGGFDKICPESWDKKLGDLIVIK